MHVGKIILTVAAASLMSSAAFAGGHNNGSPLQQTMKQPPVQVLKVKKETFVTGNGNSTSLPQFQFTPIDTETVNCTRVCTISADVSSQIQTAGADWAICITVDGNTIECQYQGVQAGPSSYVVGNVGASVGSQAIGNHQVQTQLYTESSSATYQYYAMHYAVHQ